MASEAQVAANRLNAQKSSGPRTAEGKAVVAQNAVKHGLLAREGLLRGEDGEEFARHREALMEELNPTGALEVILAARIVDLTWRLRRVAQDRSETFGALYDRHTAGAPEPAGPAERGANDPGGLQRRRGPGAAAALRTAARGQSAAERERAAACARSVPQGGRGGCQYPGPLAGRR